MERNIQSRGTGGNDARTLFSGSCWLFAVDAEEINNKFNPPFLTHRMMRSFHKVFIFESNARMALSDYFILNSGTEKAAKFEIFEIKI